MAGHKQGNMFASMDEFMRESAVNTNYNSNRRNDDEQQSQGEQDNQAEVADF